MRLMLKLRDNWPTDSAPNTKSRRRKKFGRLALRTALTTRFDPSEAHNIAMSPGNAFGGLVQDLRRLGN